MHNVYRGEITLGNQTPETFESNVFLIEHKVAKELIETLKNNTDLAMDCVADFILKESTNNHGNKYYEAFYIAGSLRQKNS